METEIISNCVGPLSQKYLSSHPHHVTACMNLHRVFPSEDKADAASTLLLRPFPYLSSVPVPVRPLTEILRTDLNGIDPTTTLVREKFRWQMRKEKILQAVRKDKASISGKVVKRALKVPAGEKAVVPRGVALLAQHLDRDPDPKFSGAYNWYYTGGTLDSLHHNKEHYLLYATHSKLNYSKQLLGNCLEPSSEVDLGNNEMIHQIVSTSRGVAVRQKSHINVLSIMDSEDNSLQLKKVHSASDENHPFVSVALRCDARQYCTFSNHGTLKLWDVEYSKNYKLKLKVEPGEGVTVSDAWSSLQYADRRTVLMADRCCLHVLDARAGMQEKQLAWCPKKLKEQCEEVSHVVRSQARHHVLYLFTTHQVLSLDLRYGFCQRWTHMLPAPPYLGFSQIMDDHCELLCLGSQVLSDCVAIVNSWKSEEPVSVYKPSILPSPARSLLLARQQGVCLDPTLTHRCTQSMTGLTFLPAHEGINIVRQSTTGDIFVQQLTSSSSQSIPKKKLNDSELASFSEWSQPTLSLLRERRFPTETKVTVLKPLLTAINYAPMKKAKEDPVANIGTSWQLSKKYLEDCVDMLAGKMLAVWEVEEEDEWALEAGEPLTEQDLAEKVMNWLDTADTAIEDRNLTADISTLKPAVTSTPYPVALTQQAANLTSEADPSPWMLHPSQRTPSNKRKASFSTTSNLLSPPSSVGSDRHKKKHRLFESTVMKSPTKQTTNVTKPHSSAKKKFIAGF